MSGMPFSAYIAEYACYDWDPCDDGWQGYSRYNGYGDVTFAQCGRMRRKYMPI